MLNLKYIFKSVLYAIMLQKLYLLDYFTRQDNKQTDVRSLRTSWIEIEHIPTGNIEHEFLRVFYIQTYI